MPSTHQRGNSDDRDAAAVYERVISCLAHNTGTSPDAAQRPSSPVGQLMTILHGHADIPVGAIRGALRAAEQREEILRWRGRDGRPRVCLAEESRLLTLIEYEAECEHPNQALIAEANRRVQALRGGRDER